MKLFTNHVRLFMAKPYGREAIFVPTVVPWRIMWRGGSHRVILRERLSDEESFLRNFSEGCTLDLIGGNCADPSDRHQGAWLYRLVNCKTNRSWIPWAGALSSFEHSALTYWLEIDCEILTMMIDLDD